MESETITEQVGSKYFWGSSPFHTFLHILIWDAHVLRVMLEGLFILVLYQQALSWIAAFSPSLLNIGVCHVGIIAILVLTMMYFDTAFLCLGFGRYNASFSHACKGDLDHAVVSLASAINSFFPPPQGLALLQLSEIEAMLNLGERSKMSLDRAYLQGVPRGICMFYGMRGVLFANHSEDVGKVIIETSVSDELEEEDYITLRLERGLYLLCREGLYSEAKKEFTFVKQSQALGHPSMASTLDIALVGELLCDIHLGRAEEALPQLESIFPFVITHAESNDKLRPYAAFFLLERAKYFSKKRRFQAKAREDVLTALSLCRFPAHVELASKLL